uniref:BED-type domain-containing protein n=1 Tax=Oryza punctata TaxID=4537 RepID=A0A0E0MLD3_ORYPU
MGGGDSDSEHVDPADEHVNPVIQALTRKFRSTAWKEFVLIIIDNEVGAGKCKHCDIEIRAKRGAGTSSLRKHLTRCKKRIMRQADHMMAVSENDPLADWVQHITEQLSDQVDAVLDMYLKDNPIKEFGNRFDILNWWKANCFKPASTIASESAFNMGSRVISDFRCSLTMDSFEALICLQDSFRASAGPNINVRSVNGISYSDNFVNLDPEDSMDGESLT